MGVSLSSGHSKTESSAFTSGPCISSSAPTAWQSCASFSSIQSRWCSHSTIPWAVQGLQHIRASGHTLTTTRHPHTQTHTVSLTETLRPEPWTSMVKMKWYPSTASNLHVYLLIILTIPLLLATDIWPTLLCTFHRWGCIVALTFTHACSLICSDALYQLHLLCIYLPRSYLLCDLLPHVHVHFTHLLYKLVVH